MENRQQEGVIDVKRKVLGRGLEALISTDLKDGSAIENQFSQAATVIGLFPVSRNDRQQFLLPPIGIVRAFEYRRNLMHILGKITQKQPDLLEGILFVFRQVVDDTAAAGVYAIATEFFLAELFLCGLENQRWTGCKYLTSFPNHYRKTLKRYLHM